MIARHLERAQLFAAAEAGTERALLAVLDPAAAGKGWEIGRPQDVEFEGIDVEVTVTNEAGKVNLNLASPATLRSALAGLGLSEGTAGRVADRIVDWRDADDLKMLNGAESNDYRAAGYADRPLNQNFVLVNEVRHVLGMTREIYECIRNDLTVYSGRAGVDLSSVSTRLGSLKAEYDREAQQSDLVRLKPTRLRTSGSIVRLDAKAKNQSGITVSLVRVIRITGDRTAPVESLFHQTTIPRQPVSCDESLRLGDDRDFSNSADSTSR